MGAAQHEAPGPVEADRLVADQPRPGKAREPAEIDVALLKGVMPGDTARQHARIGRLDVAADQRDPHARHRPHAKGLQHMDMGMPAADEDEVLSDRNALLHRTHYARALPERRAEGLLAIPLTTAENGVSMPENCRASVEYPCEINFLNAFCRTGRQPNSACQNPVGSRLAEEFG